jgi:hypothetical protein
LEDRIREKVEAGAASSVQAFVEEVVRKALGVNGGTLSLESAAVRPIWEVVLENMKQLPAEQFARLPKDGASQLDHYLYGHPKR